MKTDQLSTSSLGQLQRAFDKRANTAVAAGMITIIPTVVGRVGPPWAKLQNLPQDDGKSHVAKGQGRFSEDDQVKTVMNPIDRYVRQHLGQQNKRGEFHSFDQQQHAQPVVGAPQRDSKPVELIPHG